MVKVDAPLFLVMMPFWLMPPFLAVTDSVPSPSDDVPSTRLVLLKSETLLAPVLFRRTAPVKTLDAFVSVITLPPAEKKEVPGTLSAPAWVIAPPAVTLRLPPLAKLRAGITMAA